jgi:hypothetical protein
MDRPCKYAEGIDDEWECTCYHKVDCPYQVVEYNYVDYTTGHSEINVVMCTKKGDEQHG